MIQLDEVKSSQDFQFAVALFREYADYIGIDLSFQNFEEELSSVQDQYVRPAGVLFLAYANGDKLSGCFAIRKLEKEVCELKRMYVRPAARGLGVGKLMMKKGIETARALGYQKMRLDTLPSMKAAIHVYTKAGFYEIEPYRFNPIEGTRYFEIDLQ
ncbi:MAG: GNAT family N-acetyltransferase [Bacteroidota bacterium]